MDLHKAVRIIFVLSSALSATAGVSRPWWSTFAQRAYCLTPGEVICSRDCSKVQMCLGNLEDGYDPETMITCDTASGYVCSATAKQCVLAEESECNPAVGTFTCHGVGSYPDPYDCKVYHVCFEGEEVAETGTCDSDINAAYNPCTGDCTLTTSDRVCTEKPVKTCNVSLEMGTVPENPNIWYVCKPSTTGLYPDMYRCPGGHIFDVEQASRTGLV